MNTNSPPPPNSVELPDGIKPLSLTLSAEPSEARLLALVQFYELGKTPADVEVASALRELIRLRAACDTCKGFKVVNVDDWHQRPCPDCAALAEKGEQK